MYLWNKDIKNCAVLLKANHRHCQKIFDKLFFISLVTAYYIFLYDFFIEFDDFFGLMYYCIYLKVKDVRSAIRQKIQI
jgi:hypothetical protein